MAVKVTCRPNVVVVGVANTVSVVGSLSAVNPIAGDVPDSKLGSPA